MMVALEAQWPLVGDRAPRARRGMRCLRAWRGYQSQSAGATGMPGRQQGAKRRVKASVTPSAQGLGPQSRQKAVSGKA